MDPWLLTATTLTAALLAPLWVMARGGLEETAVALVASSTLTVLVVATIGVSVGRAAYLDVGLVLTLLSLVGNLSVAHFLERWL